MTDKKSDLNENFRAMAEKLKLDVKASMSLARNSNRFLNMLSKEFLNSQDPDVRAFMDLLSSRQRVSVRGLIFIAIGEIAFSAILIFFSLSFIIPAFFAYSSPYEVLHYFYDAVNLVSLNSAIDAAVVLVDFIICVIMLLSALQLLRVASETLRNAGVSVTEAN